MIIRRPIITLLGHVDHGKTTLLDHIRKSTVAEGEAGGITQAIGSSIVPIDTIKKICGNLLEKIGYSLTIPGLLFIDSPGHAAFTSLRERGGSLADIAILIVDINEGFKPQTEESIEILKSNKVPFIVAANKVDLINGWKYDEKKSMIANINSFDYNTQAEFEKKMYELVGKMGEKGLQAERFDRVTDFTKQISIIPVSAKKGQGIAELLMVLTGLGQKYLGKNLEIEEDSNAKGTILEVKEEKGLGLTINAIIYSGKLKVNDTIVIGGLDQPIVTKIRALLEPNELNEIRDAKSKFKNVKEVIAATGVKISAPNFEGVISGMPLKSISNKDDLEEAKEEVQREIKKIIVDDEECEGILIKADTIGSLEALKKLLKEKNVIVSSASLGDITKKDLTKAESSKSNKFNCIILGFNINVPNDIKDLAKNKGIKIINEQIIYKTIEEYEKYIENLKKEIELTELSRIVRPAKISILKGYLFRQSNPAIVGVDIEVGKVKTGDPIMNVEGKEVATVKSMKEGKENITQAQQGQQLAMALDGATIGRQIDEGDFIYTDVPEEDFVKLKKLKKHLTPNEIDILKEIAEIKRKNNPVWGV
jgi:translation initiation factor 5B